MKYYLKFLAFILALNVSGQTLLHTNGKAIVDANGDSVILKTMNLGGWMLIEPYQIQSAGFASAQWELEEKIEQLVGTAEKDIFLENWYANHVRKIDIDSLAAWGFNAIRLPMHYNLFTLSIEEEPILGQNTWLTKGFEMTDSLVSWCKQNNMYVVLDLHAAPGGQGGNTGISDYNPAYPSLWEDINNRHKTMSLWKKIAEHYVNEPAIAGYDFLNETNWNLGSNELRNFYTQLTDSVRAVDTNHIIFIEGNWYANDFSGLTPPWDNNMVYSPHKYWSKNYQADIQWALDIRDNWNVPVWFGESGENSNTWFRNAIRLFEDHDLGWAWWPMKKLESISCPMSITKTVDFENLLNYWSSGNNPPSANNAINTLFQLTEDLKLENCTYQKDVIDAMFRQVNSNETKPFDSTQSIPGRIFATDFDMGVLGAAYHDNVYSDYHVTTGSYTA
ncbi:MAG: cellulase family glycosylhydrolase, partial [Flavobacteriales bacterium]|nr:cellulase family glycosylhydrolase [Flavobacteriales bacterium]